MAGQFDEWKDKAQDKLDETRDSTLGQADADQDIDRDEELRHTNENIDGAATP